MGGCERIHGWMVSSSLGWGGVGVCLGCSSKVGVGVEVEVEMAIHGIRNFCLKIPGVCVQGIMENGLRIQRLKAHSH